MNDAGNQVWRPYRAFEREYLAGVLQLIKEPPAPDEIYTRAKKIITKPQAALSAFLQMDFEQKLERKVEYV